VFLKTFEGDPSKISRWMTFSVYIHRIESFYMVITRNIYVCT